MLLIFIPVHTSRIEYVFDLVFNQHFGIEYRITNRLDEYENYPGYKINYSEDPKGGGFFIRPSQLLSENIIREFKVPYEFNNGKPIIFPTRDANLPFDIFSAIFYMVTRYEEYLPFQPDTLERFKAKDSLAFQNNFLTVPVVDVWILYFKETLLKKFPELDFKTSTFKAILTYDIDVAYKYNGRSILRNTGAIFKDAFRFSLKNIYERFLTVLKIKPDPWDVYDYLSEINKKYKIPSVFFFLLGDRTGDDRNLNYRNSWMKKVIEQVTSFSEIGIHPSLASHKNEKTILTEIKRLENISGKMILKSRQHYLKFTLPDTYQRLLHAGLSEDYSMGFPEMAGFRAGTCQPFYFYDLKNEQATTLKIFPVTFMEGSYYKPHSKEEAFNDIMDLLAEVKKVNGIFISIFHNHTVSEDYPEWKIIHEKMIAAIANT